MKRKLVATLVALAALAIMLAPSGAMASPASNPLRLGVMAFMQPVDVLQPAMARALLTNPTEMARGLASFKLDATPNKSDMAKGHMLGINTRWASRPTCTKPSVVLKSVGPNAKSVGSNAPGSSATVASNIAALTRSPSAQTFLFLYRNDNLAQMAIYIGKQQGGESGTTPDTKPLATALCSLIVGQGSGAMISG